MTTLTAAVDKTDLQKEYSQADKKGKALLVKLFPAENLDQDITGLVKSYEDACRVLNHTEPVPYTGDNLTPDQKAINAFAKLTIIARALNEGWVPDWLDEDQYKYMPWFEMQKTVTGDEFAFHYYTTWDTITDAGSRLCFRTSDLAKYCGETFIDLYRDFLTL